jgi:hypothetical protein
MELVLPFSWALSARDTGLTGVATEDDLKCVNWLLNESNKEIKIVGDSNTIYLISGYLELIPDTWGRYGREDRFVTFHSLYKLDKFYIFSSTWNTQHQIMIECSDVGLRRQNKFMVEDNTFVYMINDHTNPSNIVLESVKVEEIYRSGDSIIYSGTQNNAEVL